MGIWYRQIFIGVCDSFCHGDFIKAKVQTVRTQINFIIEMKGRAIIRRTLGGLYKKDFEVKRLWRA
jgi:hypothetical protein